MVARNLFRITRYRYIDTTSGAVFDIFGRTYEFAHELAERINCLSQYKLREKRLFFKKKMWTDLPPYELEQAQVECVEEWEEKLNVKN